VISVLSVEASIPPRLSEHLRHVDGLGQDDGADGIEEGKMLSADEPRDVGGEWGRGQRTGCDDPDVAPRRFWNGRDFSALDLNQRVGMKRRRDALGELLAVHG
jgi:hypothetical protein